MKTSNKQRPATTNGQRGTTESRASGQAPVAHSRAMDRLLDKDSLGELLHLGYAALRRKRSAGELPFTFLLNSKIVAWESDTLSWIESVREADQAQAG